MEKDLLQRLQRALPMVEEWINELHRRHLSQSVPTSETGFERLAAYFPESLLKSTRITFVDTVPFPPVLKYGLPEFQAMAATPMAGITFGDMYFVQRALSSARIHFHELVHVVQWNTLGIRPFLLTYAIGIIRDGYAESPLEAIAYELESRFEQQTSLNAVTQVVATHAVEARHSAEALFAANGMTMGA